MVELHERGLEQGGGGEGKGSFKFWSATSPMGDKLEE